jgi:formylglycine-generating enzyme required for sulfatase activity
MPMFPILFLFCISMTIGYEEVLIPARSIQMQNRETMVEEFYLDRLEVSQEDYQKAALELGLQPSRFAQDPRYNQPAQPVNGVDWHDAYSYCRAQGRRLPTLREFTSASAGKWKRRYPFGDDFASKAPFRTEEFYPAAPFPVDTFVDYVSSEGVHMLAGNVAEWLLDEGPHQKTRVVAGGSFVSLPADVQTGAFGYYPALDNNSPSIGFRCARLAKVSRILTQQEVEQAVSDKTKSLDILVREQEAIEARRRQLYLRKLSLSELSRRSQAVLTHAVVEQELVVPEGSYLNGSRLGMTRAFAMDLMPVSVAEYQRYLSTGAVSTIAFVTGTSRLNSKAGDAARVPLQDARLYCEAQGKRLPAVNEWERAWHLQTRADEQLLHDHQLSSFGPMRRLTATAMEWTDSLLLDAGGSESLFRITFGPLTEESGVSSRKRRGALVYSRNSFRCARPLPDQLNFPVSASQNYRTKEHLQDLQKRIEAMENVFEIDFRSLEFERALKQFQESEGP